MTNTIRAKCALRQIVVGHRQREQLVDLLQTSDYDPPDRADRLAHPKHCSIHLRLVGSAQLGPVLSMGLLGLAIGALTGGPLADRFSVAKSSWEPSSSAW